MEVSISVQVKVGGQEFHASKISYFLNGNIKMPRLLVDMLPSTEDPAWLFLEIGTYTLGLVLGASQPEPIGRPRSCALCVGSGYRSWRALVRCRTTGVYMLLDRLTIDRRYLEGLY